jgi:hypothetical protein
MPNIAVRTNPEGSLVPGIMNFATTPATKPIMIVQMIPISRSSVIDSDVAANVSFGGFYEVIVRFAENGCGVKLA